MITAMTGAPRMSFIGSGYWFIPLPGIFLIMNFANVLTILYFPPLIFAVFPLSFAFITLGFLSLRRTVIHDEGLVVPKGPASSHEIKFGDIRKVHSFPKGHSEYSREYTCGKQFPHIHLRFGRDGGCILFECRKGDDACMKQYGRILDALKWGVGKRWKKVYAEDA